MCRMLVESKGEVLNLGDQRLGAGRDQVINDPQFTVANRHAVHQSCPDQIGQRRTGMIRTHVRKITDIKNSLIVARNLHRQAFKNEFIDFCNKNELNEEFTQEMAVAIEGHDVRLEMKDVNDDGVSDLVISIKFEEDSLFEEDNKLEE